MRIEPGRSLCLHPDDVAWVAEWQLAVACPWLPLGDTSAVRADGRPDVEDRTWRVWVRLGTSEAPVRLPLKDLVRVVHWCRQAADHADLCRPPASISASLLTLRRALRRSLVPVDPLERMGYVNAQSQDSGAGR